MTNANMTLNNDIPKKMASIIAREYLLINSLEEKWSDSLDFHEVNVVNLEKALLKMYQLGQESIK